jgi:hypothetical protein
MAKRKMPGWASAVGAVVVSDLHVGSSVGLWPCGFETSYGNSIGIGSNLHQRWLWDCWQAATKAAVSHFGADPWVLIVNGDCIEGRHHGSQELVAEKNKDHSDAAVAALHPLATRAVSSHFVAGTQCHTGDWEEYIAQQCAGQYEGDKALLDIHGSLVDVAHHMPTTSRAYLEAGAMSIVMGNARLNYARSGQKLPRVFIRAHRHCGGYYSDNHALFLVNGAWQMLTRHGHKVVGDSICRPSLTILDWRGLPQGSLPGVKVLTYEPKQTKPVRA